MAIIVKVKKIGGSIHLCLKQEMCRRIPELRNLKNNDELVVEVVETSKDLTSHTLTLWMGEDIAANALLIKRNTNSIHL